MDEPELPDPELVQRYFKSFQKLRNRGGQAANRKRKFAACRLLEALLSTLLYLQWFLQGHDIRSESLEGRIRCIRDRLDDFADPGFTVLKTTVLYTFHDPEGEDEVDPVGELIAISDSSESESVVAAAPKSRPKAHPERSRSPRPSSSAPIRPVPPPLPPPPASHCELHHWGHFDRWVNLLAERLSHTCHRNLIAFDHHEVFDRDPASSLLTVQQLVDQDEWSYCILSFATAPARKTETVKWHRNFAHPIRPVIVGHKIDRTGELGKGKALELTAQRLRDRGIQVDQIVLVDDKLFITRDASSQGCPGLRGLHFATANTQPLNLFLKRARVLR